MNAELRAAPFLAYKNGFLCEKIISALESSEIATIKSSESQNPSFISVADSQSQSFSHMHTSNLRYITADAFGFWLRDLEN